MKKTRNITRILILLCGGWLASIGLQAQTATIENAIGMRNRNMGEIMMGSEVKGYYLFTQEDQVNRTTRQYRLRIYDINLREVNSEAITGSNYLYLAEGRLSDNFLMLKLIDMKEKIFNFRFYDANGKLIKQLDTPISKHEITVYAAQLENGELGETAVSGIEGKGFVNISLTKETDFGFKVQFFDQNRSFLGWTYQSDPTEKRMQVADFIGFSNDMVLFQILKKKSAYAKEMSTSLLAIDLKTGKKRYETPLATATHNILLLNGLHDAKTGNFMAFGQFTELEDNSIKDNSLGICAVQISPAGKLLETKLVFWDKDVSNFLPVDDRGKIKGIGYVFFHKIIQLQDGTVYAIGEQYKRAASGVGIAVVAMGGQAAVTKMVIQDMMVFEFAPDFKLKGVSIFEKGKTNIQLPAGSDLNGPHIIARYIHAYGGFDYAYSQVPNDNSEFTFFVQDWEKEKGEKGRMTLKSVNRANGAYTLDKIDLLTEASMLSVFPAKPGYVMIAEYFRKTKKIEVRMEKFNR